MLHVLKKLENLYVRLAVSVLSFPVFLLSVLLFAFLYQSLGTASIVLTVVVLFLFAELHAVLVFYTVRQLLKVREHILLSVLQLGTDIAAFIFMGWLILVLFFGYQMAG